MKILLMLLLTGCATSYEVQMGENSFKARTFREMESIEVEYKDFTLKARGVTDDTAEAAVSISNSLTQSAVDTGRVALMGGPLVDTLGNPRPATFQELEAQFRAINEQESQDDE